MNKLLLPILVSLLLISSISNAKITSYDERFTLLCEIEESTGFNWSNGNWHRTHFKAGQKYIIKKQDDEKSLTAKDFNMDEVKNPLCIHGHKKPYKHDDLGMNFRNGCYMIKEFGKESKAGNFKNCHENWTKDKDSWSLDSVDCPRGYSQPEFYFKPNGLVHIYRGGNLETNPKDDSKGSMFMSFGRCSTI